MIKRLKYNDIDFAKYEECVENAAQKNIYAQKKILDALCESWELLVAGNYEFVMPVPLKRKLGFNIVLMPLFCQQLGVFSKLKDPEKEQQFLEYLQKNYRLFSYAFNHQNTFSPDLMMKKNYIIPQTDYPTLRKKYFKGRKSTVKTAQYLTYKEVKRVDVLDFIKDNFKGLDKQTDVTKFFEYIDFLDNENFLRIFGSYKENDLTNLAIIIEEEKRFSLLALINDPHFKSDNGASFLIDRILQENIAQKNFDFMGGNIRGIEVFFKSFGSELEQYPSLEKSKGELLRNFFKK